MDGRWNQGAWDTARHMGGRQPGHVPHVPVHGQRVDSRYLDRGRMVGGQRVDGRWMVGGW